MARILLVQNQMSVHPGIYYLCGMLRSAGHEYRVVVDQGKERTLRELDAFSPDFVAFPCLTGIHKLVLRSAAAIKRARPRCQILVGGAHPTLFKDFVLNEPIDFICRGEGEEATKELLEVWESGSDDFSGVRNISWKRRDAVFHNETRDLVDPMDALPFPDYSVYGDIPTLADSTYPMVWLTRGCPFACSYCHNSKQRELVRGKGSYVRSFGIDRILEEVRSALDSYPRTRAILLGADTLGADTAFTEELFTRYSQEFDIPYTCQMRPELITEDMARLLKDTRCHMVAFGIESGSERIRVDLLKRRYQNQAIVDVARMLKKHGVKFRTFNIVGFPTETRSEMLETLAINQAIRPDFPWCSIYTPYPGTELADFSIAHGYLDSDFSYDDVPSSFFNTTILDRVDTNYILNVHALFQMMVLFPRLSPLLEALLGTPHTFITKSIFKLTYSYLCIRAEKRPIASFVKLALANRKFFR